MARKSRRARSTGSVVPAPGAVRRAGDRERLRRRLFDALVEDWRPVLARLGIEEERARAVAARADECGTGFQTELVAAGVVSEGRLMMAVAEELGIAFADHVDPDSLILRASDRIAALSRLGGARVAMRVEPDRSTTVLIAPEETDLRAMRGYLERYPGIAGRLRLVPPHALRTAIMARARPELETIARDSLFETFPELSARIVANAWQGVMVGAVLVALPVSLALAPWSAMVALHAASSVFFLMCVSLRLSVIRHGYDPAKPRLSAVRPGDLPVYTVLVALYREAAVVPELLVSLGRLVWPHGKLEIKLICEADDRETLDAIRAHRLRPCIEIVEVPPGRPRTKPKALSYALPLTTGEYVALFDAEDRPHPLQLVEAWQRFEEDDGGDLACLQAPLAIANADRGMIARMFWFEYAALFRGLLPWLAARDLFLPLGGTSNHFRRAALQDVGAWDPYNVTEDADLGLRLKRFGYRISTIASPTLEDGPEDLSTWLPQRTRWFKGWLQTWLVHMRSPVILARQLGLRSYLIAQVLLAGMALSALVHPLLVVTASLLFYVLAMQGAMTPVQSLLLVVDLINIVSGYAAFLLMGWQALDRNERRGFWKIVLMTPAYWMLMSAAAWRAVWQLWRTPHLWEKTPHRPMRRVEHPDGGRRRRLSRGSPAPGR